jgi:hypothetical protein
MRVHGWRSNARYDVGRLRRLQEFSVKRPTIQCSVMRPRFTGSDEGAGTCEPMSERNVLRARG